jgi:hypothetical protein
MLPSQLCARWLFLEEKATRLPAFCKEQNRKCCSAFILWYEDLALYAFPFSEKLSAPDSRGLTHVEKTQARELVVLQQALVDELLLDLAKLDGLHAAAMGGQFAGGFSLEA